MISVFDLDHTLLTENCSFRFGAFLYQSKRLALSSTLYAVSCYSLHAAGLLPLQNLHEKLFNRLFKGSSAWLLENLARQFVQAHVPHLLYQPAYERFLEASEQGHRTLLLSSSPDFLIRAVADYLKVDDWSATPYLTDANNRFISLGKVLSGEGKRAYLKEQMDKLDVSVEEVYAYSDSHLDLPLLEAVAHPVGVKPNRRLRSICRRRGWEMI